VSMRKLNHISPDILRTICVGAIAAFEKAIDKPKGDLTPEQTYDLWPMESILATIWYADYDVRLRDNRIVVGQDAPDWVRCAIRQHYAALLGLMKEKWLRDWQERSGGAI